MQSCVARCKFIRQHKLATPLGTRTPSAFDLLGGKKNKDAPELHLTRIKKKLHPGAHQEACNLLGIMNSQFPYVDSSFSCINVARPSDTYTVPTNPNPNFYYVQESVQHDLHASANPSSYYEQRSMHNNPYDSTFSSNLQHVDLNSHALANTSYYYVQKPMDNMVNSINHYETPQFQ